MKTVDSSPRSGRGAGGNGASGGGSSSGAGSGRYVGRYVGEYRTTVAVRSNTSLSDGSPNTSRTVLTTMTPSSAAAAAAMHSPSNNTASFGHASPSLGQRSSVYRRNPTGTGSSSNRLSGLLSGNPFRRHSRGQALDDSSPGAAGAAGQFDWGTAAVSTNTPG